MRRWLSLVVIAAVVISACGEINPAEHEWCHIYELHESWPGLFIDHGGQDGGGIYGEWQPELSNYLYQFEIIEPFNVYPDALSVTIERGFNAGYSGAIAINEVSGTAFGHDISNLDLVGLGPGQPYATIPLTIDFNEDNPVGDNRITVSFTTYPGEISIVNIFVFGRGVSPYGYTQCGPDAATATPIDVPTESVTPPTPTNTPVPTITNTPTITLTPSITNTPLSGCAWYKDDALDLHLSYNGGVSTSGGYTWYLQATTASVWSGGLPALMLSGNYYIDNFRFRFASWDNTSNAANNVQIVFRDASNATIDSTYNFNPQPTVWQRGFGGSTHTVGDTRDYTNLNNVTFQATSGTGGRGWYITYIEVYVCPNPATPTPTPSPTYTPTPTATITSSGPTLTPSITRTPSGMPPSRTPVPTATRTLTPSPLPPIRSPTQRTPTITPTFEPSLPAPTAVPTRTFLPPGTAIGTVTAESTFPVPGFGTGAPNITAVSTAPAVGTLSPIDGHSHIYDLLSTAVVEVNDLPGDMTGYVPDPDITPMLAYAKWFLSCTSLNEILGENVGTMACHATVGISLIVILSAVYTSLRIITLVMKFAVWIFMKIRDLIPLI